MEATTLMSKVINDVERMGYKVMVALVDLEGVGKDKEDRVQTFCDIESEKLRKVIYKEIENEFN